MAALNIDAWLTEAAKKLKKAGIPSPKLDAELLLASSLGVERIWLIAHGGTPLTRVVITTVCQGLERRLKREPIAYILGLKEFYGREFSVTKDVLIPRPESEGLIDMALRLGLQPGDSILDAGTGSGCLGITLKCELPACRVALLDVSEAALAAARRNAAALGAEAAFIRRDVLSLERTTPLAYAPYKLIVANLPYVDEAWQRSPETDFEPNIALFSEAGGSWHYINFLAAALHFLQKEGFIIIEADPRQHDELSEYAAKIGFELAARDGFALLFARIPRPAEPLPKPQPNWPFP